jgi:thiol-disulfide isomerase/thioredoxin
MTCLGRPVAVPLASVVLIAAAAAGCGAERVSSVSASASRAPTPTATTPSAPASSPGATPSVPVPEKLAFQARTLDGGTFSGASLAGKPAVLWFWTPWCAVCRSEAPGIAETAKRFEGRVAFVGMAGRDAEAVMKRFVDEEGLGFLPHVVDPEGELWASFEVAGQPSYAFVGKDGEIEIVPASLSTEELLAKTTELAR